MQNLKEKLDKLYTRYQEKFSSQDPIWILHRFSDSRDIEIMGLITASYSYGQVEQINKFTEKLISQIGRNPYEFTINFTKRKDKKYFKGLNYRFNTEDDLISLFDSIHHSLIEFGSLKNLFLKNYREDAENIVEALSYFTSTLLAYGNHNNSAGKNYFKYLLVNPNDKSTCKRMNLYLRWMVRKDKIDTGIWEDVAKSKLIIPVDVHVARVSKYLKLVKRKSVDLKFALELTERLRKFDKNDPVKYDFALCHVGIDGIKI